MKKKLFIFGCTLAGGGAEKIASDLLFGLSKSFDVSLVLLKPEVKYPIPEGINVFITGLNPVQYKKLCKENQVDVSLSLLTKPNFISIFSKLLGNKTKIIVSEHCNTLAWYSNWMQKLIAFFYPKADKVICVSKKNAYNLNRYLHITNTQVIYNPYPITKIKYRLDIEHREIDFITMGSLYDVKNQALLIQAFSRLTNQTKELYILGDGVLRKQLEKLVLNLNLQDRVRFLGFQENPVSYLKKAKIFVLSSNQEGLPNALIEAMASGCAIISTDCVSGPREILAPDTDYNFQLNNKIEYAKYGVLVPVKSEQGLVEAMENINLLKYQALALQRADDFDAKYAIDQYIRALN